VKPLTWKHIPRDGPSAALEIADDFVISHRPEEYNANWRPNEGEVTARHVHLATFKTLEEAKAACERWAAEGYKVDESDNPSAGPPMIEFAAGFERWWKKPYEGPPAGRRTRK
jgi:hypothetical protein